MITPYSQAIHCEMREYSSTTGTGKGFMGNNRQKTKFMLKRQKPVDNMCLLL